MPYIPRPGSFSDRCCAILYKRGPMRCCELARAIGIRQTYLMCRIRWALRRGAIVRLDDGRYFSRLPKPISIFDGASAVKLQTGTRLGVD